MDYTSYEFYTGCFPQKRKSTIKKCDFPFYAQKAGKIIEAYTFGRIKELTDDIQMCCCEIAENLHYTDTQKEKHGGLVSQKVDDLSESYESSEDLLEELNDKNRRSVYTWLSGTGLLYRGFD